MFRCCTKFLKSAKAPGTWTNIQSRPVHKKPFKYTTMNDLPVPRGSWAREYARQNAKNNMILIMGTGLFGFTVAVMVKSDIVDLGSGPKWGSVLSTLDTVKPSSEIKTSDEDSGVSESEPTPTPEPVITDDSPQTSEDTVATPADVSPPPVAESSPAPVTSPVPEESSVAEKIEESESIIVPLEQQLIELEVIPAPPSSLPDASLSDFSHAPSSSVSTTESSSTPDSSLSNSTSTVAESKPDL